ncbi:histidine kinase [Sessilibacter sp. MAH1]
MNHNIDESVMPSEGNEVNLVRVLMVRVTVFALLVCLCASVVIFYQAKVRIQSNIMQSGNTLVQLLKNEVTRTKGSFQFSLDRLEDISLTSISDIASAMGVCTEVKNIFNQTVIDQCFGDESASPRIISWGLSKLIDINMRSESSLHTSNSGVVVGQLITYPNINHESNKIWQQLSVVFIMTLSILLLNLLIYLPVRKALKPTDEILKTISLLENGDLTARMPKPELRELRRITVGFDHLTSRLECTLAEQRVLAQRLLTVREEERRYLARELHDEFGQLLTAISADSTFLSSRLKSTDPQALPAIVSIKTNTSDIMANLQNLLSQLRPQGLTEFGLKSSLDYLVESWQRRLPDLCIIFEVDGKLDGLDDNTNVTIYRIVQESLTNALKHGKPTKIIISIKKSSDEINITISDNGCGLNIDETNAGNGVLGMRERVAALGGVFEIIQNKTDGVRVIAKIKLNANTTGQTYE